MWTRIDAGLPCKVKGPYCRGCLGQRPALHRGGRVPLSQVRVLRGGYHYSSITTQQDNHPIDKQTNEVINLSSKGATNLHVQGNKLLGGQQYMRR